MTQQDHPQRVDGAPGSGGQIVFEARAVSRSYPGVQALDGVTLSGHGGKVLAICGANGAGKSTLAKILAGIETPSSGSVRVVGADVEIDSPASAFDAGVLLMHQEPVLIDTFTIEENVMLRGLSGADGNRAWRTVQKPDRAKVREALAAVGMEDVPLTCLAGSLGPGQRQMLALSRAVIQPHRVLLLDETTASSTEEHFKDVQALVEREKAAGVAVVFVSHRMPEVFALADDIAVLRGGRLIDVVDARETDQDEVLSLMIGEAVAALEPPRYEPPEGAPPLVEVSGWNAGSARDISFEIGAGEVLGIYGLVGSGRSSVARSLSGHQPSSGGAMRLGGATLRPDSVKRALRAGIVYVPEDRKKEGFIPDFSNGQNLTLATLGKNSRGGVLSPSRERARVRELIAKYQVKGGGATLTRSLSGGNQQKVCIAKWMETEPDLVVLDEPTKGIDVGARMNIYEIIRDLAAQGKSVLVITSEAEEALMLCNRVAVLRDGALVAEYSTADATTDDLIRASLGGETA
ncbi:sugar ABC transporter ATP-binding protein [Leucobacter allii]|uniref:Sugar ABC transporter ATP-binding protein n=1 Tax=Leucobacter allii TaxID=2932247 RepID=A0ABY4FNR9_9MICO|nr:sugar ABC transporter ATP-binding protein [Leucobacter allii]UOQ57864.1 sugar ABC transporter ATP-binding protein [Leucobacter allii]